MAAKKNSRIDLEASAYVDSVLAFAGPDAVAYMEQLIDSPLDEIDSETIIAAAGLPEEPSDATYSRARAAYAKAIQKHAKRAIKAHGKMRAKTIEPSIGPNRSGPGGASIYAVTKATIEGGRYEEVGWYGRPTKVQGTIALGRDFDPSDVVRALQAARILPRGKRAELDGFDGDGETFGVSVRVDGRPRAFVLRRVR